MFRFERTRLNFLTCDPRVAAPRLFTRLPRMQILYSFYSDQLINDRCWFFPGVQIPFSSFSSGARRGRPSSALPFSAKSKQTMRDRLEAEKPLETGSNDRETREKEIRIKATSGRDRLGAVMERGSAIRGSGSGERESGGAQRRVRFIFPLLPASVR